MLQIDLLEADPGAAIDVYAPGLDDCLPSPPATINMLRFTDGRVLAVVGGNEQTGIFEPTPGGPVCNSGGTQRFDRPTDLFSP